MHRTALRGKGLAPTVSAPPQPLRKLEHPTLKRARRSVRRPQPARRRRSSAATAGCVHQVVEAILEMKQMLFFPFLSLFKLIALFVYFVFIAMYIASAANLGDVKKKTVSTYQESVTYIKDKSPDNWKMVKELHVGNTTAPAHLDGSPIIRSMLAYHTVGMWWTALVIIAPWVWLGLG